MVLERTKRGYGHVLVLFENEDSCVDTYFHERIVQLTTPTQMRGDGHVPHIFILMHSAPCCSCSSRGKHNRAQVQYNYGDLHGPYHH